MGVRRAFVSNLFSVDARLRWGQPGTGEGLTPELFMAPPGTIWTMTPSCDRNGLIVRLEHPDFPDRGPDPPEEQWDFGLERLCEEGWQAD